MTLHDSTKRIIIELKSINLGSALMNLDKNSVKSFYSYELLLLYLSMKNSMYLHMKLTVSAREEFIAS